MSAVLKATTLLGAFALTGAAATYSIKTPAQDFSRNAVHAAELGDRNLASKKMPSNFFQFSMGEFKVSNHRA